MKNLINKQIFTFFWKRQKTFISLVLLILIIYSFFSISLIGFLGKQVNELQDKEKSLTSDIEAIAKTYAERGKIDEELIASSNKVNNFLPDDFELMHTISVIETISRRTKFNITSYRLVFDKPAANNVEQRFRLGLQGQGTTNQFLEFLKNYSFITSQLLTIDSVNLSVANNVISNLSVDFYAFKPELTIDNIPNIISVDAKTRKILESINQYGLEDKKVNTNLNYQGKSNPFEK